MDHEASTPALSAEPCPRSHSDLVSLRLRVPARYLSTDGYAVSHTGDITAIVVVGGKTVSQVLCVSSIVLSSTTTVKARTIPVNTQMRRRTRYLGASMHHPSVRVAVVSR